MSIRPFVLGLALAAPLFAQANYSINNSAFSCSAALSFANSTGLDAHCTGNFSVTGGTWTSDTRIALSADGTLTLDGVAMTAPVIELNSLTQVALLGDSLIRATGSNARSDTISDGIGQVPGRIDLQPGADLSVSGGLQRTESGSIELRAGGSLSLSGAAPDTRPALSTSGNVVLQNLLGVRLAPDRGPGELVVSGSIVTGSSSFTQGIGAYTINVSTIPEPDAYALALATLATGAALARRRKA